MQPTNVTTFLTLCARFLEHCDTQQRRDENAEREDAGLVQPNADGCRQHKEQKRTDQTHAPFDSLLSGFGDSRINGCVASLVLLTTPTRTRLVASWHVRRTLQSTFRLENVLFQGFSQVRAPAGAFCPALLRDEETLVPLCGKSANVVGSSSRRQRKRVCRGTHTHA